MPFIPPNSNWNSEGYPYYVFPIVGVGVLLLGGMYWTFWTKAIPRVGGYRIVSERTVDDDGNEVIRYRKVKTT